MTKHLLLYAALPALLLAACRDETAFIPLSELCRAYAEEVCDGRSTCGCGDDACEDSVEPACDTELTRIAADSTLSYDGARADRVREDMREALRDCSPPFALTRFFEGALPVGEPCARDSQCLSQRCEGEPGRCVEAEVAPLCPPSDS